MRACALASHLAAGAWLVVASCAEPPANARAAPLEPAAGAAASAPGAGPAESAGTVGSTAGSGSARAVAPAPAAAPIEPASESTPAPGTLRVHAKTRFVWIRVEPNESAGWIGYLWLGGSVPLKSAKPRWGPGCSRSFYEVEPRGFVCVDGVRATLDAADPALERQRPFAPDLSTPWPHQYGESRGAAKYRSLPDDTEQAKREWDLADHRARLARAQSGDVHDSLAGVDLAPAGDLPPELGALSPAMHEPRDRVRPASTVAWSREARSGDRSWLLTADLTWVPKDRVVPYPRVTFHGVELRDGVMLPLALFREADRPRHRRVGERFEPAGGTFARLSWVKLTGERATVDGATFLEVEGTGDWVAERDAVVPTPRGDTPWGAPVGGEDTTGRAPAGRATWIETSVWKGWLIAYEGTRPVYVTLVSPGRGGTPEPGKDPLSTASTPTGVFKITGKFATATMVAPGELVHADVPWTQNFSGPHALHGAYWHDAWGQRKSAGCVNVSPIDGKWLYEFTEPRVPAGWHGIRWQPALEPATTFVVHD
ncbi:MAG: L,D-transpeptidase [Polyangiaceae bacterium]|nr:L,D-transpeptidase [Polyangiaceae bacterium]